MVKHSASYYFYRDNDEIELVKREFPDYIKKDIKKNLKNKWLSLDPLIKSEYEKRYLEQESENELMLVDFGNLECDPIPKTTLTKEKPLETPTDTSIPEKHLETDTFIPEKPLETPTDTSNSEKPLETDTYIKEKPLENPTDTSNPEKPLETDTSIKEKPLETSTDTSIKESIKLPKECKELKPHSSFWFYHRTYPNLDVNSLLEKWETMNLLEKEPWENMSFRENINIRLNNLEIMLDKLN